MADSDLVTASMASPVGRLAVTISAEGLAAVSWGGSGATEALPTAGTGHSALTEPVLAQFTEYFAGQRTRFDIDLDLRGVGDRRRSVLLALAETVGYGETITYGELAELSGTGLPARAIGSVMGSNPLPIVIGCHRVLAHDGLGGYSGGAGSNGLEVKRWLLTHEGALPPTLDWDPSGLGQDA